MGQRVRAVWMMLAVPLVILAGGSVLTSLAMQHAARVSDAARHGELEAVLRDVAEEVGDRLDAGDDAASSDLLAGLGAGRDVGLVVRRGGRVVATNTGALELSSLHAVAVSDNEDVWLVAVGPSTYFAAALPVVVGTAGAAATVLVALGAAAWTLQHRRRREVETDLAASREQSRVDALTGLPNRVALMECLTDRLADCRSSGRVVGVIFIDIDRFKSVNDTMGHAAGDRLLKEVARRLAAGVRGGDLVARLAGDEFVIVAPGVSDGERLAEIAQRVGRSFDEPVELGTGPFYAGLSMGLAVGDATTPSPTALLDQADAAMYVAKSTPGTRFAFFDDRLRAEADDRQVLGAALRQALDENQLTLHYQPMVSVRTDEVVAVEAFLRWDRPGHGRLSPAAFLPVAEECGLMGRIGRMVLLEACRQARRWNAPPIGDTCPLPVAVNVSGQQLLAPDFSAVVTAALDDSGLAADLLHLEISEAVAADGRVLSSGVLGRLRSLGVHLVIDDFGFRHGSLSMLKDLPVSSVKIHGSAVADVARDEGDQALIEAVAGMATRHGLLVVAECVETPEQFSVLQRLGVNVVQGHLLMPPVAASGLSGLERGRHIELQQRGGLVLSARVARTGV